MIISLCAHFHTSVVILDSNWIELVLQFTVQFCIETVVACSLFTNHVISCHFQMPVTSLIRASSGQIPLQMPVTGPTRVVNQTLRIPAPAAGPSDLKAAAQSQAHSHVHRGELLLRDYSICQYACFKALWYKKGFRF